MGIRLTNLLVHNNTIVTIDRFGNVLKLYAYLSNKGCS